MTRLYSHILKNISNNTMNIFLKILNITLIINNYLKKNYKHVQHMRKKIFC